MRAARWLACGGLAIFGIGALFIALAFYAGRLERALDSRLYPWSQRRENVQRPALSDYRRAAVRRCAPPGNPPHSPSVLFYFPAPYSAVPDLATPPTLPAHNLTLRQFELVWLPLQYLDVGEEMYQITLAATHPDPRRLPERIQVAFGSRAMLRAELSPFEKSNPASTPRFYSSCWQGGRFTPPTRWQGYTPEVAWQALDWIVIYPTDAAKRPLRWLFPRNPRVTVYFSLRWDETGSVAEAVIAHARLQGEAFELRLVDDTGVHTVALEPAAVSRSGITVKGYRFCRVRGEQLMRAPTARQQP